MRANRFLQRPWLSERAVRAVYAVGLERAQQTTGNISSLYSKKSAIYRARLANAFWEAIDTLSANERIDGAEQLRDCALYRLTSRPSAMTDIRGKVSEVVRIGRLIESGRHLDAVCRKLGHPFTYERWSVDLGRGWIVRGESQVEAVEIDAIEGDTIIEVKDLPLRGGIGKHLISILKKEGLEESEGRHSVPFNKHYHTSEVMIAAEIANQLLRYRTMIDEGVAYRLELHITSRGGVQSGVVDAMYEIFEKGTFELIWYEDLLSEGKKVLPNPSIKDLRPLLIETVSARSLAFLTKEPEPFVDWVLKNEMIELSFGDLDPKSRVREMRKLANKWNRQNKPVAEGSKPALWTDVVTDEAAKEFFRQRLRIHAMKYFDSERAWGKRTVYGLEDGDVFKVLAAIKADSVSDDELKHKIIRIMSSLSLNPRDDFWFFKYGETLLDILKHYIYLAQGRSE